MSDTAPLKYKTVATGRIIKADGTIVELGDMSKYTEGEKIPWTRAVTQFIERLTPNGSSKRTH